MTSLRSGVKLDLMKKPFLYIFLVLMWCNFGFTQIVFKLVSVYDYEVMLAKAKTDKETSDKLQIYLIGLSDGMAWTDDLNKREHKKRIYCLGDKTADVFIMMAVVNNHIKNKNYTDDQKKLYPIGLIVADAFKTEFPCNK